MAAEAGKTAGTPAGGDDSMEQILHSIRDIIAEKTEDGSEAPASADASAPMGMEEEEILELTEVVPAAAPVAPTEGDALSNIDAILGVAAPEPAAPAPAPEFTPPPVAAVTPEPVMAEPAAAPAQASAYSARKENLVSDDSALKTTAAIKDLMQNIPKPKIESPDFRGGSTVEDLVVESLKPMLSKWLDANLPLIVRELVQKEIEKLVPHETRD